MSTSPLHDRLPRHLKLRELRVLLTVAERGSFRKAAQSLHVTQPAVTAAIADLERALGVSLFHRMPQGVAPTSHGEAFIRRASAIFGELELAAEEINVISSGSQGALHVGTVPMPATGILPAALERLLDRHPNAFVFVLEALEGTLGDALKSRKIDLFISRLPQHASDPSLRYQPLFEDAVCVVASRLHPLASRSRLAWRDLATEKWILPPPGSLFFDHIQRVLHKRGLEMPRHSIETISIPVMYGMIAHGGFVSFATRSQYEFTSMKPLLAVLKLNLPVITAAIGFVTLKGRQLSPLGARLIEHVRTLAEGLRA